MENKPRYTLDDSKKFWTTISLLTLTGLVWLVWFSARQFGHTAKSSYLFPNPPADATARRETNLFVSGIDYNYQLRGFKKNITYNYMTTWLQFQFGEYSDSIRLNQDYQTARNYSYDAPLDKTEIDVIVGILIDKLLEQISEAGGLKATV